MKRHHKILIGLSVAAISFSTLESTGIWWYAQLQGPSILSAQVCSPTPYNVFLADVKGETPILQKDVTVTLSQINKLGFNKSSPTVKFYADSSCAQEITTLMMLKGIPTPQFFYVKYENPLTEKITDVIIAAKATKTYIGIKKIQVYQDVIKFSTTSSFKFGINQPFDESNTKYIIKDILNYPLYKNVFSKYKVSDFRYPGGTTNHYYFWDDECKLHNGKTYSTMALQTYAVVRNEQRGFERIDPTRTMSCQKDSYKNFLNFTIATGVHPVIGLNGMFYHDGDAVYQTQLLAGQNFALQPDRWAKIEASIKGQLDYTHSILKGPIQWEIDNENYDTMSAEGYGEVVEHYVNLTKKYYPTDEVLVVFSRGNYQYPDDERASLGAEWNKALIASLIKTNVLQKIDYFVIHYYYNSEADIINQTGKPSINGNIQQPFFFDMMKDVKSYFPSWYTPKFYFTEFSPSLTNANKNFNTQTHALLMWDALMKFHSDNNIVAVYRHTGTGWKNGAFTTAESVALSPFNTYVPATQKDSPVFPYIPPATEATRIFFEATGNSVVEPITLTDNYEMLVTKKGPVTYLQILNYETSPQTIDISKYNTKNLNGVYSMYVLPNLSDHFWDTQANKKTGIVKNTITVPGHSFTTVVVQP